MADNKKKIDLRSLAAAAPERLPYRDEEEDVEMFPADAELAADQAVAAEEQPSGRSTLYHAVVLIGTHSEVVSAKTKFRFGKILAQYHPDQILVMVKGKEIPKIIKPTLAL